MKLGRIEPAMPIEAPRYNLTNFCHLVNFICINAAKRAFKISKFQVDLEKDYSFLSLRYRIFSVNENKKNLEKIFNITRNVTIMIILAYNANSKTVQLARILKWNILSFYKLTVGKR